MQSVGRKTTGGLRILLILFPSVDIMQFKGWAQTSIQLRFDEPKQTVYGNVSVDGVNLEGVSPVANNFVTVFVQTAINERVNPLVLVNERQLSLLVPVKASNGSVKAHAKDVKAEILEGSLKLHGTGRVAGRRESGFTQATIRPASRPAGPGVS